jgi:hypothetical protein
VEDEDPKHFEPMVTPVEVVPGRRAAAPYTDAQVKALFSSTPELAAFRAAAVASDGMDELLPPPAAARPHNSTNATNAVTAAPAAAPPATRRRGLLAAEAEASPAGDQVAGAPAAGPKVVGDTLSKPRAAASSGDSSNPATTQAQDASATEVGGSAAGMGEM